MKAPDLNQINYHIYTPVPDKPGIIQFDRNMSPHEFGEAIRTKLTPEIRNLMYHFGVPHYLEGKEQPMCRGTGHGPGEPQCRLLTTWEPGGNEGYRVDVYLLTDKGPILIWYAKLLGSATTALALNMCMQCWLWNDGSAMRTQIAQLFESLPLEQ
jgi:hypothetical protein